MCIRDRYAVGGAHVAGRQPAFLIERSHGDRGQRQHGEGQAEQAGFTQVQLVAHHQQQTQQAQAQAQPLPVRDAMARALPLLRAQPQGGQQRLQADDQGHQPGTQPPLDRDPHPAQVAAMHQHAGHRQVQPLHAIARPAGPGQHDPHAEGQQRAGIAQGQEAHRRRMGHAETRDHEAGAPDQHEDGRHGLQQGRLAARGGGHFALARISGIALRK